MANEESKSMEDMNPKKDVQSRPKQTQTIADRNRQAALERAKEKEEQLKALEEQAEKERKNDGRKYDLEVDGFNIGDSLARRMEMLNDKADQIQEQIAEHDLEAEVEGTDEEEEVATVSVDEDTSDSSDEDADKEDDFSLDEDEDDEDFSFDEEEEEEDVVEESTPVPAPEPVDEELAETEAVSTDEAPVEEEKEEEEVAEAKPSNVVELTKPQDLPSQDELNFDEDDFAELDFSDDDDDETSLEDIADTDDEEELDDNGIPKSIMEKLKKDITSKLRNGLRKNNEVKISKESVSVNKLLAIDNTNKKVIDWPLMTSGELISMRAFSGTEIDQLNASFNSTARNRFNSQRDIYRLMYNHIESDKPSFEKWLKDTPFTDVDHYWMAVYVACFSGANYIPLTCEDEKCSNIFLTDDIDIKEKMVHFKSEEAKKRFYDIFNSGGGSGIKVDDAKATQFGVISENVGVSVRLPSVYNTIFENSVLDQKFIDKYSNLLTLMVYIDNMYLIDSNGVASKIKVKTDPKSVAKSCKYRIATYAKVINSLSSNGYNNLLKLINDFSNTDSSSFDDVTYQYPEVKCPKCGHKIEAVDVSPVQLLFRRHHLNQLTIQ